MTDQFAPHNPYAPPAVPAMSLAPANVGGLTLKWFYAALAGSGALATLAAPLGLEPDAASPIALVGAVISLVGGVVSLVWLYKAWDSVPPMHRGGTTPGGAVAGLFIPFYNLYWMFAVNPKLCSGIDNALHLARRPARAPKGLAIAAPVFHFLAGIGSLAGGFVAPLVSMTSAALWVAYMVKLDEARIALAAPGAEHY